ncbi:hypothetical protein RRG08_016659 [Elysia crispata]|uniref:G-protein coupled receptors family 1 profile domain-containing protein n=1 Tax=Elysia crispata TaxID=231223 RepID=A0AAE0Z2Q1_9GAST|nr:hypothetical protein RRG08_016659 [Elysia crispata]
MDPWIGIWLLTSSPTNPTALECVFAYPRQRIEVVAVAWPLRARSICTMRHAYLVVLLVWLLSFLFAVPNAVIMEHIEVGVKYKSYWCEKQFSSQAYHVVYELYMLVLVFIFPLSIMFSTYGVICFKVWKFSDMRTDMRSGRVIAPGTSCKDRNEAAGARSVEENSLLRSGGAAGGSGSGRSHNSARANLRRSVFKKKSGPDDSRTTRQQVRMTIEQRDRYVGVMGYVVWTIREKIDRHSGVMGYLVRSVRVKRDRFPFGFLLFAPKKKGWIDQGVEIPARQKRTSYSKNFMGPSFSSAALARTLWNLATRALSSKNIMEPGHPRAAQPEHHGTWTPTHCPARAS